MKTREVMEEYQLSNAHPKLTVGTLEGYVRACAPMTDLYVYLCRDGSFRRCSVRMLEED